jgi:hypothetical protein
MVVRNEQHIIPICIGHLLNNLKVDRVLVADNGSSDSTKEILERIARQDERVRWTDASGPFLQSEIVTELAMSAYREGARWILPNDADEFFAFGTKTINGVPASSNIGAFEIGVRTFIQFSWVRNDHPRALESMFLFARPIGNVETGRRLVESGAIASVQHAYPGKLLLRAHPSLVIEKGNHKAKIDGDLEHLPRARVLHAPLRAADRLAHRRATGIHLNDMVSGNISWHLRRLRNFDDNELTDEWRANSTTFGLVGLPGRKMPLWPDFRLRRIAISQRAFAASINRHCLEH